MDFKTFVQERFNYPTNPTPYQTLAIQLALESPYVEKEPWFVFLAAYFILCSRQHLPKELAKFLPKNIKSYSLDSAQLFPRPDETVIHDFVNNVIAPDFGKIKDCFFKLGGHSAKTKARTRAKSLDNISDAMLHSDRYRLEYQFSHVLNIPVHIFFNEDLCDARTEKEIRVMIKDNKIQGISSYKMNGRSTYSSNFIPRAIEFLNSDVLPLTTHWQQHFVIDVLERKNKDLQIVEFNPYYTSMPCFYGTYDNIGKPFIIEDDRYGATELLKETMAKPLPLLKKQENLR